MLSHICGNNCITACQLIKLFNNIGACELAVIIIQRIFFLQAFNMLYPLRMFFCRQNFQNTLQDFLQISDDSSIHRNIFVYFCRIHINLENFCLWSKGFGISGHSVAETCSQRDQKVALTHSIVGGLCSVHSYRTGIQLIFPGKSTFSHKAVAYRSLDPVCKLPHLFGSIGDHGAASHEDKRLFCLFDHAHCRIHILLTDGIRLWFHCCNAMTDIFAFCSRHILRNIHQHRTRTSGFCDGKGFADGVRKFGYIFNNIAVFCHRHDDARNIHLLERIFSQKRRSYVAGDCHHRNRVHARSGNSGYKIRSAGAGCGQTYAYFSGGTCVTVCCMRSSLFMGGKYMIDFVTVSVKCIIDIQDGTARISENGIHTLLQQTFYDDFRTCKLQFIFLLLVFPESLRGFRMLPLLHIC